MAGQRTRIRFGSVSAEVLLEKTSTKPKAAQHETRRVLVDTPPPVPTGESVPAPPGYERPTPIETAGTDPFGDPVDVSAAAHAVGQRPPVQAWPDGDPSRAEPLPPGLLGPMGDPTWPTSVDADFDTSAAAEPWDGTNPPARDDLAEQEAEAERLAEPHETPAGGDRPEQPEPDRLGGQPPSEPDDEPSATFDSAAHPPQRQPVAEYVPPATRVEQGVHLEDGTWVDLTDRLTEVDQRTRVDGLEVVRTIPASSYASERVREAHYLCGVDPDTFKVLALLWRALRSERMAAEVRWTKRTAQANGIIVARGELPTTERPKPAVPAHLLLLELEWAAQIKRVPPRARGPITADVAVDELVAATELVQSFAAPAPREELRDERLAKRAELLELARAGKLAEYEPPAEPMPEDLVDGLDVELAEAMALAASWNREHAPA